MSHSLGPMQALRMVTTAMITLTVFLVPNAKRYPFTVTLLLFSAVACAMIIVALLRCYVTKVGVYLRRPRDAAESRFGLLVALHYSAAFLSISSNSLLAHQLAHCSIPFFVSAALRFAAPQRLAPAPDGPTQTRAAMLDYVGAAFAAGAVALVSMPNAASSRPLGTIAAITSIIASTVLARMEAKRASSTDAEVIESTMFVTPVLVMVAAVWAIATAALTPGALELAMSALLIAHGASTLGALVIIAAGLTAGTVALAPGTYSIHPPAAGKFGFVSVAVVMVVALLLSSRVDGYYAGAALCLVAAHCAVRIQLYPRVKLAIILALSMALAFGFTAESFMRDVHIRLSPPTTRKTGPTRMAAPDTLLVIGFVPPGQYIKEARHMLYASWSHVTSRAKPHETKRRIDLLFFADPHARIGIAQCPAFVAGDDFSLTFFRPAGDYTHRCGVVEHEFGVANTWRRHQYLFMYSLAFAVDSRYHELFLHYDWILRTDADTFITPNILTFRPEQQVVVGEGFYSVEKSHPALRAIATDLKLRHHGLHNLGSTWFIRPALMLAAGPVITRVAKHMLTHEFPHVEETSKRGLKHAWPEWWRGVTSMYAAEIGLNAVLASRDDLLFGQAFLDVSSAHSRRFDGAVHLHPYHNQERFSKFVFHANGYNPNDFPRETLDLGVIRDYATFVALHEPVEVEYLAPLAASEATVAQVGAASTLVVAHVGEGRDDQRVARHMLYASWSYVTSRNNTANRTVNLLLITARRKRVSIGDCVEIPLTDDGIVSAFQRAASAKGGPFCGFVKHRPPRRNGWDDVDHSAEFRVLSDRRISSLYSQYAWVVKMDSFAFLTPRFMTYLPGPGIQFVAGQGQYGSDTVHNTLLAISEELGLRNADMKSIGSTWMMRSILFTAVADLTFLLGDNLLTKEFGANGQASARGLVNQWPHWWRGVSLRYAAQQAVSTVISTPKSALIANELVDVATETAVPVDSAITVHSMPNGDAGHRFSRYVFAARGYNASQFPVASLDIRTVRDYATFLALHYRLPSPPPAPTPAYASVQDDTLLLLVFVAAQRNVVTEARRMLYGPGRT
jgi:hypothetical protein